MNAEPPPLMKHAGDIVFPDIDPPLPLKLLSLALGAWWLFGPLLIGIVARRGRVERSVCVYAAGVFAGLLVFTQQSGLMGEALPHRVLVWARYIWTPMLAIALALSLAAWGLGRWSRRI